MGQVFFPSNPGVILTAVDRLVATNADGGLSPAASHVVLFGEDAGQNNSQSNVIAIGAFAVDGGLASAALDGTIAIGVSAASTLFETGSLETGEVAPIIIGKNAAALLTSLHASVIIGTNALANYSQPVSGLRHVKSLVIIGDQAAENANGSGSFNQNVIIGFRAFQKGASGATSGAVSNVMIGDRVAEDAVNTVSSNVFIGASCAPSVSSSAGTCDLNVAIGADSASGLDIGTENVLIGRNVNIGATPTAANQQRNVCLGASATVRGSQNVIIGYGAENASSGTTGVGNIFIGYGVGAGSTASASHQFLVETVGATGSGAVRRGVMYGDMTLGNLIVGLTTPAVDRDMPGTNSLKIINGTATGNPVGGGMFYVTAGELRWRSSAGVDYLLTPQSSRGTFTVATLPAANLVAGQKAYVSDALAPAFATAVAGGGAVLTPVYYTGAAWFCG